MLCCQVRGFHPPDYNLSTGMSGMRDLVNLTKVGAYLACGI